MSTKHHRCSCGAFYLTRERLVGHLEDQSSQASYHFAQLQKSRAHTNAGEEDDDDDVDDDEEHDVLGPTEIECGKVCPRVGCARRGKPFTSRQRLRRHFRTHVEFKEEDFELKQAMCPFCHQTFDRVAPLTKHYDHEHKVKDKNTADGVFFKAKYDILDKLVRDMLARETTAWKELLEMRKRVWAGENDAPPAQRPKLSEQNGLTTDSSATTKEGDLFQLSSALDLSDNFGLPAQPTSATITASNNAPETDLVLSNFASIPDSQIYLGPRARRP